jgi:hypothetical protein
MSQEHEYMGLVRPQVPEPVHGAIRVGQRHVCEGYRVEFQVNLHL